MLLDLASLRLHLAAVARAGGRGGSPGIGGQPAAELRRRRPTSRTDLAVAIADADDLGMMLALVRTARRR